MKQIEAIEKVTKEPLDKEKKAVAARKETQRGFGPPGGAAPQPPGLKTFAEKRTASVAAQLAGKSKGYVPGPIDLRPAGRASRWYRPQLSPSTSGPSATSSRPRRTST